MEISVLKQQIRNKEVKGFYIFVGEEWAVQKMYIERMAQCRNLPITHISSIKDVYSKLVNKGFINKVGCYVVRDDEAILKEDRLQQRLDSNLLGDNILILILTQFDRRIKLYKLFEDKYIHFDKMPLETLKKYVKQQINLSDSSAEKLIRICEQDYGRILLEIDKIHSFGNYFTSQNYKDNINVDEDHIFRYLIETGTIYVPPTDAIFELVDAILKRNVKLTYELLQDCYDIGEANLVILSNLYMAFKQLLQVQNCDNQDIMETTGLTYPQVMAAKERLGHYRNHELIGAMDMIRKVEKGIKTGEVEDSLSVEYILANIF